MNATETTSISPAALRTANLSTRIEFAGNILLRYGLALILFWIGGMKFTAYEAEAIRPFVENSPLFAWTYPVFGQQGLSNILGVTEIVIGLLIVARLWLPRVSAIGSLLAAGMFLSTLSFLITTPQAWAPELGFPAAAVPGQFLMKDIALLGAALWSAAEALQAAHRRSGK